MNSTVTTSTIHLECIDGSDDHFHVELAPGDKKVFGSFDDASITRLNELKHDGGVVIISNNEGALLVDATDCAVPVKINGHVVLKAVLKTTDILKIGNSIWKSARVGDGSPAYESFQPNKTSLTKSFGSMLGLDELADFKISTLFSEVFKKHTLAETEEQLVTGTSKNTPSITDIEINWAKPWLFSRIIVLSVGLTLLLIAGLNIFENQKLIPGLIFIGTFVMPLASVIFFMEVNAPRNISIFLLTVLLFSGGVASLLITLLISNNMQWLYDVFNASGAAIIEEPAKILIVVLVLGKYVRYKWILNGLLLGAAVGAGFGAFESAGYAFERLGFGYDSMIDNIILRGLLAPFMHVVWTANAAAALWMVKGDKNFKWEMLADGRFLRVFFLSMATHFTWNASFGIFQLPYIGDVKFLLLGLLSWTVCFMLIQSGLKQLNKARHAEIERLTAD